MDVTDIITRAEWGAQCAAGFGPAPTADEVWLHHSATIAPDLVPPFDDEYAAMRTLERIGQQRFGKGISYTFAVMPNGRVYEGTGAGRVGAHTGGRNTRSRGIVLVGNYDRAPVPDAMARAVADLLRCGQGRPGYWHQARLNGGHQQAPGASTACPGRRGMAAIPLINARAAALVTDPTTTSEEDDMTPEQHQLLIDVERHLLDVRGVLYAGDRGTPKDETVHSRLVNIGQTIWRDAVVHREVNGEHVQIPVIQEIADAKSEAIRARAEIAALATALAATQGEDVAALVADTVRRVLSEETVHVDISVGTTTPQEATHG